MTTIRTNRTRILSAFGAVVLAGLVCALPRTALAAPDPPQLSIAVDDGQASAAPADSLSYAVSVTNLGTRRIKDLVITQTVPDGAALRSSDPTATEKAGTVSWSVDVKPGKTATMGITVTVGRALPDGLLRLASVGCARVSAKAAPVVCASDSDLLPAGAAAIQTAAEVESPVGVEPVATRWALGGAGLAAVLAAGAVVLRRRRRTPARAERP